MCLLLAVLSWAQARAAGPYPGPAQVDLPLTKSAAFGPEGDEHHEPTRLVAAALAVTLGPFGVHRLYLGTNAKVPIFYGLTFGGFGVLVLIDLAHILFTKDLAPFQHNDQVLMWAAKTADERATPP